MYKRDYSMIEAKLNVRTAFWPGVQNTAFKLHGTEAFAAFAS